MYNIQIKLTLQNALRLLQIRQVQKKFMAITLHPITNQWPCRAALLRTELNWSNSRGLCTNISDYTPSPSESSMNEMDPDPFEDETVRKNLYSQLMLRGDCDEIVQQLNKCKEYNEIFKTIENCKDSMHYSHLVYSVILLWNISHGSLLPLKEIADDKHFDYLLEALRCNIDSMNINQLSCCYLYLRKIGLENSKMVMRELLLKSLDAIASDDHIPLPALSRLIVAINSCSDFHTASVCISFPPHIESHIKQCCTAEEARLLSICMVNLHQLTKHDILDSFKVKVVELMKNGVIGTATRKCVLKILHMLGMPFWSHRNALLIRDLMTLTQPHICGLSELELRSLHKIFQRQLEPASVIDSLKIATERYLNNKPTPEMLAYYVKFSEPHKRESLIALFKQLLSIEENWLLPNASANFFLTLRGLKISDFNICDSFWTGILKEIDSYESEDRKPRIIRFCRWYMNFNNNLGGTYRHLELERTLSKIAMHMIEEDIAGLIPATFARLAAFVIGYGHTNLWNTQFPNIVVSKMISMRDQFSIIDCLHMSRGLQIAFEMRFHNYNLPPLTAQLTTLENVLTECTQRHLHQENLGPVQINSIVRSLNSRKCSKKMLIYDKALSKYKEIDCSALTSRTIRDMAHNLSTSNYIVPEILEAMFEYLQKNHKYVSGDTVEKTLTCAYSLGYTPNSTDVMQYAAQILLRDFEQMSGLSVVKACLALCYYKSMPEELISKVFCVNFIKRIEEEIQICYSKATYPDRVLNLVMQLNRTVCLDFPEANVPWFQQNFLEAQLSKKPFQKTRFSKDVQKFLKSVLKDETYFRCNHVTPYGYRIDFVIHFDNKNNKPIPAPVETAMLDRITKVAILLLKLDSFCENNLTYMHGQEALRMKHLEMMGYKVLHININDWNSKYMNAPDAKENYIKCLLKISNGTQSAIKQV